MPNARNHSLVAKCALIGICTHVHVCVPACRVARGLCSHKLLYIYFCPIHYNFQGRFPSIGITTNACCISAYISLRFNCNIARLFILSMVCIVMVRLWITHSVMTPSSTFVVVGVLILYGLVSDMKILWGLTFICMHMAARQQSMLPTACRNHPCSVHVRHPHVAIGGAPGCPCMYCSGPPIPIFILPVYSDFLYCAPSILLPIIPLCTGVYMIYTVHVTYM